MATNRQLQLLRSGQIYASFTAAKAAIEGITGKKDGEIVLARYISSPSGAQTTTYESAIGVYAATVNSTTVNHWTVFKSSTEIEAAIQALQTELDNTQAGAGLGSDGSYTAPVSGEAGFEILGGTGAPDDLREAIMKVADYVYDTIADMDYSLNVDTVTDSATTLTTEDASKVVTAVNQTDGQIAAGTTDVVDLVLTGYSKTADTGSIAATDTVEEALSKLENSVSAVGVTSDLGTIDVAADGRTIDVNIDGTTIVADANDGTLSADLKIVKIIPSGTAGTDEVVDSNLPTNVREAYRLIYATDSNSTAIGKQINIYKDSALTNVYLGHVDDALTNADSSTHESADTAITSGTGSEALCFIYHLENDNYKLEAVNVESFLQEAEFKDGLEIDTTNHTVQVKAGNGLGLSSSADTDGNKFVEVVIDSTNDNNTYLSVGANGVALDGDAIDEAIAAAKTTVTTVAAVSETTADGTDFIKVVASTDGTDSHTNYAVSTQGIKDYVADELADLAISAAGDSVYIAAAVDASDNKKINVTGTYGAFNTPTASSNSLSATTNGIAKAEDVATAVNTVIGNLDGSATATAASGDVYTVLTSVTETDGVITKGGEVTLAAVAKTGDADDVTYDNTDSGLTATDVQAAIDELDGRIDALGTDALESVTSANAGIAVGTKANHSQELTLTLDDSTVGTGSELTGTYNALTITNDGLFLSNIWDCGTFDDPAQNNGGGE